MHMMALSKHWQARPVAVAEPAAIMPRRTNADGRDEGKRKKEEKEGRKGEREEGMEAEGKEQTERCSISQNSLRHRVVMRLLLVEVPFPTFPVPDFQVVSHS